MRCERATVAEVFSHFAVFMCLGTGLASTEKSDAATQLIALTGDVQPGGLARLSYVSVATLNNAGNVVFRAGLTHGIGGVGAANDSAVWRVAGSNRSLVAWEGVTPLP